MNETFEKLCKKHSLSENAKIDFKNLFEKEIIKVFNKKSNEKESTKESTKESIIKKITKTNTDGLCVGKKADGKSCTFKAKPDSEYCGRHNPDKSEKSISPKTSKPRVKKDSKNECHATIPKTGKKCIQPGTIQPEGSDFHYCKRHSEKWIDFEQEPEQELGTEEAEEAEEATEEAEEATEEATEEAAEEA